MVRLIIDYAIQHHIILNYTCNDDYKSLVKSSILTAININNSEMVELLIE